MKRRKKPTTTSDEPHYDYEDYGDGAGTEFGEFPRYKSVAERQQEAKDVAQSLADKGVELRPVRSTSRKIAKTFWGQAWCRNLESYSDYEYRLPRGRSYLRSGNVIDLVVARGEVRAKVSGSYLYDVEIDIDSLETSSLDDVVERCGQKIGSVVSLLSGKLDEDLLEVFVDSKFGLFPEPNEIKMSCTCLDDARLCKHVAAVLYGVGVRLDEQPELFFELRGIDKDRFVTQSNSKFARDVNAQASSLDGDELSDLFGIDVDLGR